MEDEIMRYHEEEAEEIADTIDSIADDTRGHSLNGEQKNHLRAAAEMIRNPTRQKTQDAPEGEWHPGNRVDMLEGVCGPDRKFDPVAADAELASIPLVPLWDLSELHPRKVADECLTTMERARQSTKPNTANRVRLTNAIELMRLFITQLEINERGGK